MLQHECPTDSPLDILVHVPKTAGLSLRTLVIKQYGPRSTWVYSSSSKLFFRADQQLFQPDQINSLPVRVMMHRSIAPLTRLLVAAHNNKGVDHVAAYGQANAIIGHYPFDTFDTVPTTRDQRFLTVVRDPLARMVSHYRYSKAKQKTAAHLLGRMAGEDVSLPFQQFALSDTVQNLQVQYTGEDLGRYSLVGVTERFSQFLMKTGLIEREADIPHNNPSKQPLAGIDSALRDPGFVREFEQFHAADYQMYDEALKIAP